MLISTKVRYALGGMTNLAEHQAEGLIPLKVIAQRQEISEKYRDLSPKGGHFAFGNAQRKRRVIYCPDLLIPMVDCN